jgi:DNA transposition AAA+ family ATPase
MQNPPAVIEKHENATAAMQAMRYRIPGDVVNKATSTLADDERSALRWLHSFASERNYSLEEVASLLKQDSGKPYSRDSVYQALTGRRAESGASLAPIVSAIERLRKIEEARAVRAPFIETTLTQRIWKICETALNFQRIAFIYGDSQIGKTTALEEYQRTHNHGETIYVRMPAGGTFGEFIRCIAKALRISPALKDWQMKDKIFASIDSRMLLIVDQCHECFLGQYSDRSLRCLLFVMEIFDRCHCGIVLVGTAKFEAGIMDSRYRETLKQLVRRGLPKPLRLPDKPTVANLNEFSAAYGIPPATDAALALQADTIRDHDLGIWLTTLQAGQKIATKRKEPMAWKHVIAANAAFLNIAGEGK